MPLVPTVKTKNFTLRSDRYDFRKFPKAIKSVSIDKGNEIEKLICRL